jgi:hypothetical protein
MRRHRYLDAINHTTERLIAAFGAANLVRTCDDRIEVRGGTESRTPDIGLLWNVRFLSRNGPDGVAQTQ